MSNKLIITTYQKKLVSAIFNDKDLIQANVEEEGVKSTLGNIYVGKVQNIVKNINAAFVEIAPKVICYLSLEDAVSPIFTKCNNSLKVKIGDELIVQVGKEAVKTKAPVVTTNFNIPGKYVVLVHGKTTIGISGKITLEEERNRLRSILLPYKNDSYGFIIRTNATNVEKEIIEKEIEALISIYMKIKTFGIHKTRFSHLYENHPNYICEIRDNSQDTLEEIITDIPKVYDLIKDYLTLFQPEDLNKLRFYEDKLITITNLYGLQSKLENARKPHVWLKSGGSLVIQPTEALTVIDVNTEKAIAGKKNAQDTFFKVNMEAAVEIARQIRLRNLSGIIIIDFIDMLDSSRNHQLMKELERLFRMDPVKTVVVDMTALGLVEVTRKKVRRPLHEQFT